MVRAVIIYSDQHEKKSTRCNIHSELYNTSPQFVWYGKKKAFVNSEPLGVTYTQSLPLLKS